jgi:hypothetical protein
MVAGIALSGCEFVAGGSIETGHFSFGGGIGVVKGANRREGSEPDVRRLKKRLQDVAITKSFPAYVRANFEHLSQVLDAGPRGPEKWDALASWAVEEGLTGGSALKPATAKRAYEREAQRQRAAERKTAGPPQRSQTAAVARPLVAVIDPEDSEPLPTFKPARLK